MTRQLEDMSLGELVGTKQLINDLIKKKGREEEMTKLKGKLAILESGKEVFECPNCDGIFPALEHDVNKCNYLNR